MSEEKNNKTPYLRRELTQKEMQKDAIKSIGERKKGRHRLTYDKETKTIIAVVTDEKLTQDELADNLKSVYRGEHSLSHDVYVQLWEQIYRKPIVTMKEIENAVGDTSDEYTEGVVELFESKGFEIGK